MRNGLQATGQLVAPDDARVLGEYGKTLLAQGRTDDALAFLARAIELLSPRRQLAAMRGLKGHEIAIDAWSTVVRRIPDLNPKSTHGQQTLFDTWRFHAFFTTTDHDLADTVSADKTHRGHAIIEQVHADLKNSALAHLPSGKFTANAAWLACAAVAFNLTRAAAVLAGGRHVRTRGAHRRAPLRAAPSRVRSVARGPSAARAMDRTERRATRTTPPPFSMPPLRSMHGPT